MSDLVDSHSTEQTDDNPWVIEFRNGFYFESLEADHSVSIEHARRFPTMRAVDDFVTKHEWILFNGGMPVEICATCSKPVAYRGQVHCSAPSNLSPTGGTET